jgi:hypothetical protein
LARALRQSVRLINKSFLVLFFKKELLAFLCLCQARESVVSRLFSCLHAPMPLLDPLPDPVPFEEVAAVLARAATRVGGGPPAMVTASGHHLAAALEAAGFRVVRQEAPGPQLTL